MDNPEQAVEVLKVLSGSGVELTLDDFGTGFSSLAYLHRFPFDTIKINGGLVRGCGTGSGAAIMRSMVALAHELSMTITAEGVERADEAVFLRSIGCEYAQGYHFGEPIPERAVSQLLKMVRRSERKLQPRGFFRPKPKSISKDAKKPAKAIAAPSQANAVTTAGTPAKPTAALPSGSVVRQRQRPASPATTKPSMNGTGAPMPSATTNGALNGTPMIGKSNGHAKPAPEGPSPRLEPITTPTIPPSISASLAKTNLPPPSLMQSPSTQTRSPSGAPSPLQPPPAQVATNGSAPPAPAPGRAASERPEQQRDNIVSPLADALARASGTSPLQGSAPPPPPPPGPAKGPAPAGTPIQRSDTPTIIPTTAPPPLPANGANGFPSEPATQPDFSTLPPSIAASLARLAGTPLPGEKTSGGPAGSEVARGDAKKASKIG